MKFSKAIRMAEQGYRIRVVDEHGPTRWFVMKGAALVAEKTGQEFFPYIHQFLLDTWEAEPRGDTP